ncbi:MAG: hypothetical protein RIC95_14380 [Vicingaceae bacterium]
MGAKLATAQNGMLMLHGRVVHEDNLLEGVEVEIISDQQDTIINFTTRRNGSYKANLRLGAVYNVAFFKEGYIDKSVGVIGLAPEGETIDGRYFYQLDIELYKLDENRVDETMIPPVAKLYIEDPDKGFTFDKQYVKWVQDEYEELTD